MEQAKKSFPVSRYLASVKRLVTEQIPEIWVHGVISQMTVRDRICYLTLSEYMENDVRPLASLSLTLFNTDLDALNLKLSKLPKPFELAAELKVSLLLQADFYVPQGRFQAKVLDIDPVYTLGELALTRQAILKRLDQEGLRERNHLLAMPALPLRVGLVTAPGSAAFHDFTKTLATSGFAFEVVPAYARMQGNETESTVLQALGKLAVMPSLDVICIVRGGGSKSDLNYFDSEALCRAIALSATPVLTGIGHEIDQSLVDLVAWRACITPTDSAKFLIACVESSWNDVQEYVRAISRKTVSRLERERNHFQNLVRNVVRGVPGRLVREGEKLHNIQRNLKRALPKIFAQEQQNLARNRMGLRQGAGKILHLANLQFALTAEKIKAADPLRIVQRGYSITTGLNGKVIRSPEQLAQGSELTTRFAWGEVRSTVVGKTIH